MHSIFDHADLVALPMRHSLPFFQMPLKDRLVNHPTFLVDDAMPHYAKLPSYIDGLIPLPSIEIVHFSVTIHGGFITFFLAQVLPCDNQRLRDGFEIYTISFIYHD